MTIIDIRSIRLRIFILFNPAVQRTINSLSFSNFKIVNTIAVKKENEINLVKTFDDVKIE